MGKESNIYASLGASSSKQGMLDALSRSKTNAFFADPIEDVCGDPEYYSFLHADGAGTKAVVAYLAYRETGEVKWFRGLAQDSLVMNLDDLACVGVFDNLALSNTIGRNKFLVPDEAIGEIVKGYKDVVSVLKPLGISILMAGGETADLGDLVRTLVVDSTIFGRAKKKDVISTLNISANDIIVGLSNTGQASYEYEPNSSMGSNGYTLARHALISKKYLEKYPEILDPSVESSQAYRGQYDLFDTPDGMEQTIAEALLSPTRTYTPVVRKIKETLGENLHAALHCSGGGQTKIIRFGENKHYIKDNLFPCPPVFGEIQRSLRVPWQEMYSVFNMGHRMEILCPEECFEDIAEISRSFSIEARRVGYVEDSPEGNRITIEDK